MYFFHAKQEIEVAGWTWSMVCVQEWLDVQQFTSGQCQASGCFMGWPARAWKLESVHDLRHEHIFLNFALECVVRAFALFFFLSLLHTHYKTINVHCFTDCAFTNGFISTVQWKSVEIPMQKAQPTPHQIFLNSENILGKGVHHWTYTNGELAIGIIQNSQAIQLNYLAATDHYGTCKLFSHFGSLLNSEGIMWVIAQLWKESSVATRRCAPWTVTHCMKSLTIKMKYQEEALASLCKFEGSCIWAFEVFNLCKLLNSLYFLF